MNEALADLGGLDKFVKPGQNILLKVNLLTVKKPDQAATTHPDFVEAVANIFIEFGCNVFIADSPGGPFISPMLKRVYKATGMKDLEDRLDITLNYDTGSKSEFVQGSLLYKSMKVCNYLDNMDHIISMSKMKTHALMTLTGAVKNMFGIIPGLTKAELHAQYPKYLDFANMIIDVCEYANPTLSFMDGIVAMEGEGPGSGDPKVMNTMLISDNPYHLDYVASKIMKLEAKEIPTIVNSITRGFLKEDFSDVEIIGELEPFIPDHFEPAKTNSLQYESNGFLLKILKRYPRIIKNDCIGCKLCAEVCPANTIDIIDKKAVINYKNCITCFCCHEFCPTKAIDSKRRLFRNFGGKR
jgi:uncharacterized protein (DUF362 family)/Pyruvate/2-oxoacid:ferredoxin oxidoreductase delta subunit